MTWVTCATCGATRINLRQAGSSAPELTSNDVSASVSCARSLPTRLVPLPLPLPDNVTDDGSTLKHQQVAVHQRVLFLGLISNKVDWHRHITAI